MNKVDRTKLEEALDYILQQQLISHSFRIYNRTKKDKLLVAGTKANLSAIKEKIMKGLDLVKDIEMDAFINFLVEEFNLPRKQFEDKLEKLTASGFPQDITMFFIQVTSVLREFWQDVAYKEVVDDVHNMVTKKGKFTKRPSRDLIHEILCNALSEPFSLLVNLYVVRTWSKITGKTINFRGPWLSLMNTLTAQVISACKEDTNGRDAR